MGSISFRTKNQQHNIVPPKDKSGYRDLELFPKYLILKPQKPDSMFLGIYHFAILVCGKHFNKSMTNSNESLSAIVVFFKLWQKHITNNLLS